MIRSFLRGLDDWDDDDHEKDGNSYSDDDAHLSGHKAVSEHWMSLRRSWHYLHVFPPGHQ
jgi:hypothetical protein